jgi:hypothetical protein
VSAADVSWTANPRQCSQCKVWSLRLASFRVDTPERPAAALVCYKCLLDTAEAIVHMDVRE